MPPPRTLPPNPSLLAIFLIITTRRGPRFVFHYPSLPESSIAPTSWHFSAADSSSDADSDSTDDDATNVSGDDDNSSNAGGAPSTKPPRSTVSGSTVARRTARTLREDGPDDDEDDDDIETLDLNAATASVSEHTAKGRGGGGNSASILGSGGAGNDVKSGDHHHHHHHHHHYHRDNDDDEASRGKRDVVWERVLGYPTEALEKMLSPPKSMRKKRFEVMVEGLVFLGYPVFAREDGFWQKQKKQRRETKQRGNGNGMGGKAQVDPNETPHLGATFFPKPGMSSVADDVDEEDDDDVDVNDIRGAFTGTGNGGAEPRSYGSHGAMSDAFSDVKSVSTATSGNGGGNGDDMSMFHVVFVMSPPALEYHIRVEEMYENVSKKFAKALKYEQAKSGYVEREAKKILNMKNHAKESKPATRIEVLWPAIIAHSGLAKAMANVYTSISASKIAHVSISESFDASLQIPQAICTPYVSTPTEPQLPGLWLTTASMLEDNDGSTALSPQAALLLLEERDTLLKEIESDNKDLAAPLSYFIRELTPTKSLQKLSTSLSLPISDMQFLARHLIYWRRARAIPPLHIRDTYIVSPNCDMRQLSRATQLYAQRFSALPSLPVMLQKLSQKPIQYGYLIPTKDHKPAYMDILAWLLRGGWVTQLRSFAWVRVSPAIKAATAQRMRRDAEERAAALAAKRNRNPTSALSGQLHHSRRGTEKRPSDTPSVSTARTARRVPHASLPLDLDAASSDTTPSRSASIASTPSSPPTVAASFNPISASLLASHSRPLSDTASVSSAQTTIAAAAAAAAAVPSSAPLPPSPHPPATPPLRPTPDSAPMSPTGHASSLLSSNTTLHAPLDAAVSSVHSASASISATTTTIPAAADMDPTSSSPLTTTTTTTTTTTPAAAAAAPTAILHLSLSEADYEPSLVLSPHTAGTLESAWLATIGLELAAGRYTSGHAENAGPAGAGSTWASASVHKDDEELGQQWRMLVGYFDGRRALEEIAGREGLKRGRVAGWINRLEERGLLVVVRHW